MLVILHYFAFFSFRNHVFLIPDHYKRAAAHNEGHMFKIESS